MENPVLKKIASRDYELTRFGEKGTLLSHQGQPIFIVGSGVELRDDFFARLIEAYLQSTSNKVS